MEEDESSSESKSEDEADIWKSRRPLSVVKIKQVRSKIGLSKHLGRITQRPQTV